MGLRERVRQAIEGPVGESEKLLSELPNANAETKLSLLINAWGRGLSAAIEELAIAVDDLGKAHAAPTPGQRARSQPAEQEPPTDAAKDTSAPVEEADSDEQLIDESRRSREETAELRKESERDRRDLEQ
jgi:hypothetical protein